MNVFSLCAYVVKDPTPAAQIRDWATMDHVKEVISALQVL